MCAGRHPQGGFFLWVTLPEQCEQPKPPCCRYVTDRGVIYLPSSRFLTPSSAPGPDRSIELLSAAGGADRGSDAQTGGYDSGVRGVSANSSAGSGCGGTGYSADLGENAPNLLGVEGAEGFGADCPLQTEARLTAAAVSSSGASMMPTKS